MHTSVCSYVDDCIRLYIGIYWRYAYMPICLYTHMPIDPLGVFALSRVPYCSTSACIFSAHPHVKFILRTQLTRPSSAAGAVILFPDDWHLEEKIGLPLGAVHYPVSVLNAAAQSHEERGVPSRSPILRAMEHFFDKMYHSCDATAVFNRFNWAFQVTTHICSYYFVCYALRLLTQTLHVLL